MNQDRMFHVLVLGGVALLGGCGTSGRVFVATDAGADAGTADGSIDGAAADVSSIFGVDASDAFPLVGAAASDAGFDGDAAFPVEAP